MRLKSHIQYNGSKSKIVKIIEKYVPEKCKVIISPFIGGGSFEYYILEKNPRLKLFCYDNNKLVINYHKCLISNPKKLYKTIIDNEYNLPIKKDIFIDMKAKLVAEWDTIDSFEKAGMYYSISLNSYTGDKFVYNRNPRISNICNMNDYNFNTKTSKYGRIYIKNKDAFSVIKRGNVKDNPDIFIFLDPPDYKESTVDFDHIGLHSIIKTIKSKWIVLYRYNINICDMYSNFNITTPDGGEIKSGCQMIIANF